ncbi:MAG: CoB--CoM heterodisulfide reductase iron-sulfur subunit A family protein [Anaerolineales bacterium]|nr:CoB--CoM heterodisulfide reductase iron-sulfur subunit A family protein [Anaerolineales bacterium]
MARIGVFVCHCGTNIASIVDVEKTARLAADLPGVVYATDYKYMCSDPGQKLIAEAIRDRGLDRIVVAACSPHLHELTFRHCLENEGLNPYLLEMANIREQCSWVHTDRAEATEKAVQLMDMARAKVRQDKPLFAMSIPIERRALIIGGGISGIQAAIDVGIAGYEAVIVEREPSIGGRMAQFDRTFPTLDCAACILTPKMVTVARDKNITIYTYSEVEEVSGYVGSYVVRIRRRARSVISEKCTGCGTCWQKCPQKVPSEFDEYLGPRKAIYIPFPQAVPRVPVIDREHCIYYQRNKCRVCEKFCEVGAIDFTQEDELIEERFGAIIVATGFTLFDWSVYGEYGGRQYKDVIRGLQFERMVNSSGPTGGKITRPSDGKEAHTIVFIQCVGSRDRAKGVPYCSRLCCMYTAKQALLFKEQNPDGQAYVFYMDIRAAGKNYEEFVRRAQEEFGVQYLRGRVSRIFEHDGQLVVWGADTLSGNQVEIKADLVVLATALVARDDAVDVARMLGIPYDENRLFTEAHPKLAPVETVTRGVFLTGACQAPKDIPDTIATASAASAKTLGLFSHDFLAAEPMIARIDPSLCSGCFACQEVCPFGAIEETEFADVITRQNRIAAQVVESLCHGCGNCTVVCKAGAPNLAGFSHEQVFAQVAVV